jgi:N6-adenosine-specific RNA methylase IME4
MTNDNNSDTKSQIKHKKYKTILADPPWDLNQMGKRGASYHYNLMSLEQIKAMPIADLAEDDAHLWLWIPTNELEKGYEVVRAWGFIPKSVYTWRKPKLGLGNYLRGGTEHCIFAIRGKLPIQFKAQMNWGFHALQDHSHKPEEFHEIIKRCSPGPYLELFARREYAGFDVWGNEIESDVVIPNYPVPKYSAKAKGIK